VSSSPPADASHDGQPTPPRRGSRRAAAVAGPVTLAMVAPFAAPAAAPAAQYAFRPSADASVNLRRPNARFGARSWLRIASAPRWRVYLRFRVRGLDGPVRSAQLVLQGRRRTWTPRLQVRAVGRPWRERRVTARRAARLRDLGVAASTRRDGRRTRRVVVNVTSAVAREGIVTLVVSTPNRRGLSFYSREVRRRAPRLVVTTRDAAAAQTGGTGGASGTGSGGAGPGGGGGPASGPATSRAPGGLWVSRAEIAARPASGAAWNAMRSAADGGGTPALADQDSDHDVTTLAAALVAAKTGSAAYRDKAKAGIAGAIGSEAGGRSLGVGRNLPGYVIAADVINLPAIDPALDMRLRGWLHGLRTANLDGDTLVSTHELRPNNWGTMAGAARIAASAYVGDTADLQRAATVFRGWLGDRGAYTGFEFGDLSYQADPANPVAVGPPGATRDGLSVDGALADDMRRGCALSAIPCHTDYAWEAMQGAVVQAELLWRAGYDAWGWQSQALLRAARYLLSLDARLGGWWAEADDTWQPWLLNHAYRAGLPTTSPSSPGKVMAWTDWTHGG
jgi:hypothetical protein